MSRISTYEIVPVPKLADKLIGTSVGGEIEDITYNFTLSELLNLFLPNIPSNNLQGVLDFGNEATQDIILNGTIFTTNLEVSSDFTILNGYFTGETHILGGLYDSLGSIGTPGQVLISTGTNVEWYTIPTVIPTLQEVLTSGNTANIDIVLDANLQALTVSADNANISTQLTIQGVLIDHAESVGISGQVLSSTSTGVEWVDLPSYGATSPLLFNPTTGIFSIQVANNLQGGYLTANDWMTFDGKQNAGNYITSLTGEATATGPGAASVTLSNSAVIGKLLTGLNVTGGTVVSTDSIISAFGKVQNQINGLVGGVFYQGVWNAFTNTPVLTSGIGVQGYYYVVNVAGSTNLDGVTDWNVGDWAIFSGGAWSKVDNTDAVVSVNGQVGAVSLTTDNIPEGLTNLYFLNSRARASLSFAAGSGAYNSTTGVITIPTNTNQLTNGANYITLGSLSGTTPIQYNNTTGAISITQATTSTNGYLSSTDWNTFNSRLSSVGLSMPSAFTVTNSPLTSNGVISVTGAGSSSQYVRGDGQLGIFPTIGGGGGGSVYYLNGNTSQGSISGTTMYQLSKTASSGAPADFTRNTTGTIASFITDVGDPSQLTVPPGIWLFEIYFSEAGGGSNHATIQAIVEKWDGTSITVIATGVVEEITNGSVKDLYTLGVSIPNGVTLSLTDRIVVQIQIANANGKNVTLYTENGNISSVTTTFANGISSINGLTASAQTLGVGTSGTDFGIVSSGSSHTFNLPTASASNRGALSSANWTTFNNKQNAITLTTTGSSGASTFISSTLNVPNYTLAGLGGVPTTRTLTINGVTYDLSADRSWTITAGVSSVTASSPLFSSGGSTPNITIQQANVSQNGFLSSTDWSTFNSKQSAITLTTTGTSGAATFVSNTLNIPNYGSALTAYVPYTGATTNVNLGAFNLAATRVNINGATDNSLFSLNNGGGTLYTNGFSPNATYYSTAITLGGGTSYVYNGSGNIAWALPTPSGNNQVYFIRNASTGSGVITLNAFSALGIIDNTNAAVSSISIAAGSTVIIQQDGGSKSYQLNSAGGGSSNPVALIAVSGTQNSSNKTFTLASAPTSTTNQFFINGQLMTYTEDYTLSGSTITIATDRPAPSPTDALLFYGSLGSGGGGGGTVDELQVALISQVYG